MKKSTENIEELRKTDAVLRIAIILIKWHHKLTMYKKAELSSLSIGERIKKLRIANKMTLVALCAKLDIAKDTLIRWEKGERIPPLRAILDLIAIFGTTLEYLTGKSNVPVKPNGKAAKVPAPSKKTVSLRETEQAITIKMRLTTGGEIDLIFPVDVTKERIEEVVNVIMILDRKPAPQSTPKSLSAPDPAPLALQPPDLPVSDPSRLQAIGEDMPD
jgi:transcriptional regulator with XRE-family HTH domain